MAEELGCLISTLQRYRQDINMISPYKIPITRHKEDKPS